MVLLIDESLMLSVFPGTSLVPVVTSLQDGPSDLYFLTFILLYSALPCCTRVGLYDH